MLPDRVSKPGPLTYESGAKKVSNFDEMTKTMALYPCALSVSVHLKLGGGWNFMILTIPSHM